MLKERCQMRQDRVYEISGWRFVVVFILLSLMFLLAVVGVLAIIIGVVDIWPRIQMIEHGKWRGLP
jgi:hypothetical protein